MIRIHFVGDGPRDVATVPHLVGTILGRVVTVVEDEHNGHHWARLQRAGSGYTRKLLFAVRVTRDAGLDGLVAVVDRDKAANRERLGELKAARERDREKTGRFPTALGEADPHGEAWLLDDPAAVRQGLRLDKAAEVASVRKTASPKQSLDGLMGGRCAAPDDLMAALAEVAKLVDPSRCNHQKETGFRGFMDEVRSELGPLSAS